MPASFQSLCMVAGLALGLGLGAAAAQPPIDSSAAVSSDPNSASAAAAVQFHSAVDGYRAFADVPVAPWVRSNDVVRANGGWRAYAKEAAVPLSAPDSTDAGHAAPQPGAGTQRPTK